LLTLIDSAPWWSELKTNAEGLKEALEDLIVSVKGKEPDSAEKAGKVHGLYHRLVHDFYHLLPLKTEEASS
ncbi:MAG: hypothetical protein HY619_07235, partial [Thaumarchaeota archaeon]|nr:hypothetical protein [Nitrososphaerota archaeon]